MIFGRHSQATLPSEQKLPQPGAAGIGSIDYKLDLGHRNPGLVAGCSRTSANI